MVTIDVAPMNSAIGGLKFLFRLVQLIYIIAKIMQAGKDYIFLIYQRVMFCGEENNF